MSATALRIRPVFTYQDAVDAAGLLREIYACHSEAADRLADASRVGGLTTAELESLVTANGLTGFLGYAGDLGEITGFIPAGI